MKHASVRAPGLIGGLRLTGAMTCLLSAASTWAPASPAQAPAAATATATATVTSTLQRRMNHILDPGNGAWTPQAIDIMGRLRDAALADEFALSELKHLTNNIGPRLSGSPQAEQAVLYVAGEMRSLGATVTLEKTTVPHWVGGADYRLPHRDPCRCT